MNILAIIWEIICDIYWSIISPDARINEVRQPTMHNFLTKSQITLDSTP